MGATRARAGTLSPALRAPSPHRGARRNFGTAFRIGTKTGKRDRPRPNGESDGVRGLRPQVATLAFSFLAARTRLRSALAALASGVLDVLVKRSLRRTALPESWRR